LAEQRVRYTHNWEVLNFVFYAARDMDNLNIFWYLARPGETEALFGFFF
jgi:hypothetical protein